MVKVRTSPFAHTRAGLHGCRLTNQERLERHIGELLSIAHQEGHKGVYEVRLQNEYLKHIRDYIPNVKVQFMSLLQYQEELVRDLERANSYKKRPTQNLLEEYRNMDSLDCEYIITAIEPAPLPKRQPMAYLY